MGIRYGIFSYSSSNLGVTKNDFQQRLINNKKAPTHLRRCNQND